MTSPISPELSQRIAQWRLRCADGTITIEEMQQAVIFLRDGRVRALATSDGAKRKRAIAAIPAADDMLNDLA